MAFSSGVVSLALCLALVLMFPGVRNDKENGLPEDSVSDVFVCIYIGDKTLSAWEDVGPRLEALGKYVPLPEGKDTESADINSVPESADDQNGSSTVPNSILSTDSPTCDPFGNSPVTDQVSATIGCGRPYDGLSSGFVVFAGSTSKSYYLREDSITVDNKRYPLTPEAFEELWALFGTEETGQ